MVLSDAGLQKTARGAGIGWLLVDGATRTELVMCGAYIPLGLQTLEDVNSLELGAAQQAHDCLLHLLEDASYRLVLAEHGGAWLSRSCRARLRRKMRQDAGALWPDFQDKSSD